MKILDISKKYFNGFQEISGFKRNDSTKNALATFKILSYFTVVIPLSFAIAYGAASLSGRVSLKNASKEIWKHLRDHMRLFVKQDLSL